MSAQLGERAGGGPCAKDVRRPGSTDKVDCVLTTWSEDVVHAADADGDLTRWSSSGWPIDAGGIGALGPATTVELPLNGSTPTQDRDRSTTTVTYNSGGRRARGRRRRAGPTNSAPHGTVDRRLLPARTSGREPNDDSGDTTHAALLCRCRRHSSASAPSTTTGSRAYSRRQAGYLEVLDAAGGGHRHVKLRRCSTLAAPPSPRGGWTESGCDRRRWTGFTSSPALGAGQHTGHA